MKTYNDIWPKEVAPWVIILSSFVIIIFLVGIVSSWIKLLNWCCGVRAYKKIKVDTIDVTFVEEEGEDASAAKRRKSSVEADFDRSESNLLQSVSAQQQNAHNRLMARLRRGSARVQSKLTNTTIHPLTRRPSSMVKPKTVTKEAEEDGDVIDY
jgi:hypothetical protein